MIGGKNIMDYRKQCVADYLNGEDIKKLANKYSVVESTIYRWIKNANLTKLQIITAKIAKVIPINIQNEILQTLSATPLRQGYDEIKWNKEILINYIKNKYNIEIDIKIAELLFEKKRMISKDKEEEFDNIVFDLEQYGYNIVFIDWFKIVKMNAREIEPIDPEVINTRSQNYRREIENRTINLRKKDEKKSNKNKTIYLNLNIILARADKCVYMEIIPSYEEINCKENFKNVSIKFDETIVNNEKERFIKEKNNFINKVCKSSKDKFVFICKGNMNLNFSGKRYNDKFIYVKEELYNQYLKCAYEENISLSQAILDYSYSIKKQRIDGVRDLNLIINECLRNYLDISKGEVTSEEAINRLKRYKDKYIKVINSKYI